MGCVEPSRLLIRTSTSYGRDGSRSVTSHQLTTVSPLNFSSAVCVTLAAVIAAVSPGCGIPSSFGRLATLATAAPTSPQTSGFVRIGTELLFVGRPLRHGNLAAREANTPP